MDLDKINNSIKIINSAEYKDMNQNLIKEINKIVELKNRIANIETNINTSMKQF